MKTALNVLKTFNKISGLKINVEKTKAIWIGVLCHSENRPCLNYELDWTQGPFKILGFTFSSEVFDIWELNQNEILNKIENILVQWSKRKLTLFGRVTVI